MTKRMSALVIAVLLLFSCVTVTAQTRYWQTIKAKKVITFDWNCARKQAFPKRTLGKIVDRAIPAEDRDRLGTYGDRAFTMKLTEQGAAVYFVPTVCGGTGNCTWRLYSISPLKYLGEINGQYIYTHQSEQEMPVIITYTHMSAAEGILSTYSPRSGKYRWLGDEYKVDSRKLEGRRMPRFLERAKRQCKDYGG